MDLLGLAKAALAFLPTAHFVALRPLFSFRQAQFVEDFPLKPVAFCKLYPGLGNTNKSCHFFFLILLSDCRPVPNTLSSPPSFL